MIASEYKMAPLHDSWFYSFLEEIWEYDMNNKFVAREISKKKIILI